MADVLLLYQGKGVVERMRRTGRLSELAITPVGAAEPLRQLYRRYTALREFAPIVVVSAAFLPAWMQGDDHIMILMVCYLGFWSFLWTNSTDLEEHLHKVYTRRRISVTDMSLAASVLPVAIIVLLAIIMAVLALEGRFGGLGTLLIQLSLLLGSVVVFFLPLLMLFRAIRNSLRIRGHYGILRCVYT